MADRIVLQFSTAAPSSFVPFTKGWPNRYSKAIRMLGHTYFSHADLLVDRTTMTDWLGPGACEAPYGLLGASNNPDAPVIAGSPSGVAIRPPDYQSFGIRRQMVLRTERADAILNFAFDQVGKPFDSAALSPKVFLSDPFYGDVESRDWRNPERWFCMEMIICAFEDAGYWGQGVRVPIKKNRVTPADGHLLFLMDPNLMNRDVHLLPVPTLRMGRYEV